MKLVQVPASLADDLCDNGGWRVTFATRNGALAQQWESLARALCHIEENTERQDLFLPGRLATWVTPATGASAAGQIPLGNSIGVPPSVNSPGQRR